MGENEFLRKLSKLALSLGSRLSIIAIISLYFLVNSSNRGSELNRLGEFVTYVILIVAMCLLLPGLGLLIVDKRKNTKNKH